MAKLTLNKTSLKRETDQLRLCLRLLPPLDMKRRQLTAQLRRARRALADDEARLAVLLDEAAAQLPMLAHETPRLAGLLRVTAMHRGEENVVGVRLPVLAGVEFQQAPYDPLAAPPWLDVLLERLREAATLRLRIAVGAERVERLERATRRITQRVNLFDKVLIPGFRANIRRIRAFLADAERAAVVRSKLAKAMHQAADTAGWEPQP